jgi:hypothetical protein
MGKWWRNQVVGPWHVLIGRAHACRDDTSSCALCLSAPRNPARPIFRANRRSILAMEYYAPVMDALMGHFVYICIFMHFVDVQASSGDGRYWEQEKCGD